MVSVAILGISLAIIMQLFSGGLLSAEKAGEYTKATLYAKQEMDEFLSGNEFRPGQYSGDFPEENYKWHAEITPYTASGDESYKNLPGELFEIKLRISWTAAGAERSTEFSTLKYVPRRLSEN